MMESKRRLLEDEKRRVFSAMPCHSFRLRRLYEDFKKVDRRWSAFTEDLENMDQAIRFLEKNLDYLRSCRKLLISAKRDLESQFWRILGSGGSLLVLFRHSEIGRANEMACFADKNLKMAQKELVCLKTLKTGPELFRRVLFPLLQALFEDIYVQSRFESLKVLDNTLSENWNLTGVIKEKRNALAGKIRPVEQLRLKRFFRLGSERRERTRTRILYAHP